MYISYFLVLLVVAVESITYDDYHKKRSREVENAIKRYSREANLEIDEITTKRFDRKFAGKESIKSVSETSKFKYGIFLYYLKIICTFISL